MTHRHKDLLTQTWSALITLTVAGTALAYVERAPGAVSSIALAAAALKAWWILLNFLELRHAPAGWRAISALWICLILGAAGAG